MVICIRYLNNLITPYSIYMESSWLSGVLSMLRTGNDDRILLHSYGDRLRLKMYQSREYKEMQTTLLTLFSVRKRRLLFIQRSAKIDSEHLLSLLLVLHLRCFFTCSIDFWSNNLSSVVMKKMSMQKFCGIFWWQPFMLWLLFNSTRYSVVSLIGR